MKKRRKDGDRTSSNDDGRPRPWAKQMRREEGTPLTNVPTRTRSSPIRGIPPFIRWDRATLVGQAGVGGAGTPNTSCTTHTNQTASVVCQEQRRAKRTCSNRRRIMRYANIHDSNSLTTNVRGQTYPSQEKKLIRLFTELRSANVVRDKACLWCHIN